MLKRGGLGAGRGLAVDERQVDRPVGVGVRDRRSDARVDDLECDLLAALARKRLAGRLARLDLAADELPVSAERLAEPSDLPSGRLPRRYLSPRRIIPPTTSMTLCSVFISVFQLSILYHNPHSGKQRQTRLCPWCWRLAADVLPVEQGPAARPGGLGPFDFRISVVWTVIPR